MTIQRVSWADHTANLRWPQGEHVLIVGPTGSGKTTLASKLIAKRQAQDAFIVMPVTKHEDRTLKNDFPGFVTVTDYNPKKAIPKAYDRNVMVWPKLRRGMESGDLIREQRRVFKAMFNDLHQRGRRTVLIDEMHMMSDPHFIGLGKEIALGFHQGRSAYLTFVVLSQRPSWIPVIVYPSVSHAYIAKTGNADDLKRLAELGGVDAKLVAETVRALPSRHDYLYINPTGDAPMQIVNVRQ